jgi:hypothetical protein
MNLILLYRDIIFTYSCDLLNKYIVFIKRNAHNKKINTELFIKDSIQKNLFFQDFRKKEDKKRLSKIYHFFEILFFSYLVLHKINNCVVSIDTNFFFSSIELLKIRIIISILFFSIF